MNWTYGLVILGVVMVSYSGPLVKGALLEGAAPAAVAFWRMLLAAALLLPVQLLAARGEERLLPAVKRISRKQWAWSLLASACLALHYLTWMTSLGATSTFASVALVCTQPLFVAALSGLLLKERMPRSCLPGAAIALIGAAVIGLDGFAGGAGDQTGNLLALAGALCMAGHWLCGRYARRSMPAGLYSLLVYSQTAAILLAASPFLGGLALPGRALWYILGLALGCTILGHYLFTIALGRVSATVVSFALLGEPVGAMLWSLLMFGEKPTLLLLAGGLLVLAGLALYTRGAAATSAEAAK